MTTHLFGTFHSFHGSLFYTCELIKNATFQNIFRQVNYCPFDLATVLLPCLSSKFTLLERLSYICFLRYISFTMYWLLPIHFIYAVLANISIITQVCSYDCTLMKNFSKIIPLLILFEVSASSADHLAFSLNVPDLIFWSFQMLQFP